MPTEIGKFVATSVNVPVHTSDLLLQTGKNENESKHNVFFALETAA